MNRIKLFNKRVSVYTICMLILSFLFTACTEKNNDNVVNIQWKDNKAESILIPTKLLPGLRKDSVNTEVLVRLVNNTAAIIGNYETTEDAVIFHPLIPFSRGLKYEVYFINKQVAHFEIPIDTTSASPQILAVYPSTDTMPANLLKLYILFSKPMQEGEAVKNIWVIKNDRDTIPSIFLDLESELWNKERTMLTLWLDPGRIKRDLQPNIESGQPLKAANHYTLLIKQDWSSADGKLMASSHQKSFYVSSQDTLSPDPAYWTIVSPNVKTLQPLLIHLHEPLDYSLLKNAFRVTDSKGNIVEGGFETTAEETILSFTPAADWTKGNYTIKIEPRLEDLAGNNLNRLFDQDLSLQIKKTPKNTYTRSFFIE